VQKALHQRHIKPFIELSADFSLNSDHLEAHALVQANGTHRKRGDSCHHGVKTTIFGRFEQVFQHGLPNSSAAHVAAHVDRIFD
jgi:hypothetical protein